MEELELEELEELEEVDGRDELKLGDNRRVDTAISGSLS